MIKLGVEYKFYLLPAISVFASHTLLLEVYYGGVLSILPSFILFFFSFYIPTIHMYFTQYIPFTIGIAYELPKVI